MVRVEIWASGGGTNADEILKYFGSSDSIQVVNLACNRRGAGAFDVAHRHNISSSYWSKERWHSKEIISQLKNRRIDFIILAGFLRLVPSEVTSEYSGKIINIHPSLLPNYGGKNMYGDHVHNAILAANEVRTGITIHEVNQEFDKGKILAQYSIALQPNVETLESVRDKIQLVEHAHFAPTIEAWIKSKAIR